MYLDRYKKQQQWKIDCHFTIKSIETSTVRSKNYKKSRGGGVVELETDGRGRGHPGGEVRL